MTPPPTSTSPDDGLSLLESTGALLTGHFQLSSGLHSNRYCQCARLFEDPAAGDRIARLLAPRIAAADLRATHVLAPALGGILWGYDLARALGLRSFFAERPDGTTFHLRRSFAFTPGDRVLLAEDVVTTGKSVLELVPLVESAGAAVVGIAAVVDRSEGRFTPPPGVPFFPLLRLTVQAWPAAECPLCKTGVPVVKPGSRAKP